MTQNPWKMLLASRKFLLLMLDVVVSMVLYFAGKYIGGEAMQDVQFLIVTIQPVFVMLIYAIAKEDAALKANGNYLKVLEAQRCAKEGCCEKAQ